MRTSLPASLRILVGIVLIVGPLIDADAQRRRYRGGYGYTPEDAAKFYEVGRYDEVILLCEEILRYGTAGEAWDLIYLKCLDTVGRYKDAAKRAQITADRFPESYAVLVAAEHALRLGGEPKLAKAKLELLNEKAKSVDKKKLSPGELTALGKAALRMGAEPKLVLSAFFNAARKRDANNLDAHIAAAELALEKHDYALADKTLKAAQKVLGEKVDILYGLARTYFPSDRPKAEKILERLLAKNPSHVPSLLLNAEAAIDSEKYDTALQVLSTIRETNPHHPDAWAFDAAVQFMRGRKTEGEKSRENALAYWKTNPRIDYLIGQKLSQKRRFEEGCEFFRSSLEMDPGYLNAKAELGQNLLRLGRDEEGWKLVSEVHEADGYNVTAYNLMNLHDHLKTFETIKDGHFVIRMPKKDASVYGDRVVSLLQEAEQKLCKKYGFEITAPIVVELFPDQQDFAVRTLGMPGGLGLLGACFGRVITMNSPGSIVAGQSNWESTLWHKFCHTVTLGVTNQRIPRWLTEGFAVYEEAQRRRGCGQQMTPMFRRMILSEDRGPIPLSELSSALLAYNEPQLVDFAYFQSRLVVEYLLATYGPKKVATILKDLAKDEAIEDIMARRIAKIDRFDAAFARFARKKANGFAPKVDWEVPDDSETLIADPAGVEAYLKKHPNSFWALTAHCRYLLSEKEWEASKKPAKKLLSLYPEYTDPDSAYWFLAQAHRKLEETDDERKVLKQWIDHRGDAAYACQRLMELDREAEEWDSLENAATQQLAINPLLREPHRALGYAAVALGKNAIARAAFERLLLLDPLKPADVHYQLARLTLESEPAAAKKHVLRSLEESPRFRKAHKLLLSMNEGTSEAPDLGEQAVPEPEPSTP